MIIGLTGYARAGKDTVGEVFQHRGYRHCSFASPLKRLARQCGWDGVKDEGGRRFLQQLGDGARRIIDPDVWVNIAMRDLPERVVFTDCRFPNEWDAIKARGGIVIRIVRPGLGPINDHVSETAVDDRSADHVIVNGGTLIDLRRNVHAFISEMEGLPVVCRPSVL